MKVLVCCIADGSWYPRGFARMVERFHQYSPGYDILGWVNTMPPGAPDSVIQDGVQYRAYCAKPFALDYARAQGATQAILLDASFFPIRSIFPMVEHIQRNGYYLCRNGFKVGEWCSDAALAAMNVNRDWAFEVDEISSYCVGLDFSHPGACRLLADWIMCASDPRVFPGHHTAGDSGRNPGFVSRDPRVKGHRHDQTALSLIADRLNLRELCQRPFLTAYQLGYGGLFPNESTVLVNYGVIDGQ